MRTRFLLLLSMIFSTHCSLVDKVALNTTAKLTEKGAQQLETETNWDYFGVSTPSQLKFLEGLYFADPENEILLRGLVKGFSAYAFLYHETLLLEDNFKDLENSHHLMMGKDYYTKALQYGEKLLKIHGLGLEKMGQTSKDSAQFFKLLNNTLDSDDLSHKEMVFFSAQALGGLLNIDRFPSEANGLFDLGEKYDGLGMSP